jgi:hypothetical protein
MAANLRATFYGDGILSSGASSPPALPRLLLTPRSARLGLAKLAQAEPPSEPHAV